MEDSTIEKPINGLELERFNDCFLYRIEKLTDEIKGLIKDQLVGIWTGTIHADKHSSFFSLKKTAALFIDRYETKSDKIKKGMIGELLTHLLINKYIDKLKPLSIFKNKEERSIRKGFDILYYDNLTENIWYSEVKSGESTASENEPDNLASTHLNNAKKGILDMFNSDRESLWESALIDVELTVEESNRKKDLSDLLKIDSEDTSPDKKSVILVSVLFHELSTKVTLSFLDNYLKDLILEGTFASQILISIHKETYQAVENFIKTLSEESGA